MPGSARGPVGATGIAESVKDGKTSSLFLAPPPSSLGIQYFRDDSLSFELANAPLACVPTSLKRISLGEMRVLAWLRQYKSDIIAAEAEFSVDRRAIAGAIAWEGLVNNKPRTNLAHTLGLGRSVGPGKPHVKSYWFAPFDLGVRSQWTSQVEERGIIEKQTYDDRKVLLKTPAGAIRYIGAAMDLIAIIYESQKSPPICEPPIRINPYILTNEYNGFQPDSWAEKLKTRGPGDRLVPKNDMPLWLMIPRNMALIEDGVGGLLPQLKSATAKGHD